MDNLLSDEQKKILEEVFNRNQTEEKRTESIKKWTNDVAKFLVDELGAHFVVIQVCPDDELAHDEFQFIHTVEGCGECSLKACHHTSVKIQQILEKIYNPEKRN